MFAVLKTGGKQYKVQAGDILRVELLDASAGQKVQFNDILMLGGDSLTVGAPLVAGAAVQAEVIEQERTEQLPGHDGGDEGRGEQREVHEEGIAGVESS